jgi:cephalosporin-C deacetylase-like acetyl esterase
MRLALYATFISLTFTACGEPLAGTKSAEIPANIYDVQYQQTEATLLKRVAQSPQVREKRWHRDFSSAENYEKSVAPNRQIVAKLIGLGDRVKTPGEVTVKQLSANDKFTAFEIEFQLYDDVRVDGLLFLPHGVGPFPVTIACHGDMESPETGVAMRRDTAVIAPRFVPRVSGHPDCMLYRKDFRYILHRFSYALGRHPIGVDVETVQAVIDNLSKFAGGKLDASRVSVRGAGQGGLTAMYAAAVDQRIKSAEVVAYFGDRSHVYDEPPDRAIFRQLVEFDDSDVCCLIAPRELKVFSAKTEAEWDAVAHIYRDLHAEGRFKHEATWIPVTSLENIRQPNEVKARRDKLFSQLKEHFHKMIEASADVRAKRWATDARSPDEWTKASKAKRDAYFDLVGRADFIKRIPLNPRTQKAYDTTDYVGYKVLLDVADGLEAYGILLIPKNIKPDERRPAVICQHGFAGTPEKTVGPGELDQYYHRFPHTLAQRGYVTFTPHIVVMTEESEYRLDRIGKSVGESRVGVCTKKYNAIVDFLQTLPFVDGSRVGYQGLSYGGFTGLWVVSQEPRISPVIVAGYFSDWKARLYDDPKGYMPIRSECMYVWDQLNTFNHSDLASMTCPRPFFVEHGIEHGPNWIKWTTSEYKHVESLYTQLGIADRQRLYMFPGGHETGTEEAFEFLDKWLKFTPTRKPTGVVFPK